MSNYVVISDIDNFPAGYTTAQKQAIIDRVEEQIERLTGDFFYAKSFSIVLDGNGKNRIFPSLRPDILSITSIKISEVTLPSTLYAFDKNCIFRAALASSQCKAIEGITLSGTDPISINITSHGFVTGETVRLVLVVGISPSLDGEYVVTKVDADNFTLNGTDSSDYSGTFTSGTACFASLAELHYLTDAENGLFPKGIRNIEVTGTYGWPSCPLSIKEVCIVLCRKSNNSTLYTTYYKGTEHLGDYSYSSDEKVLTGVREADLLLREYIKRKPMMGCV